MMARPRLGLSLLSAVILAVTTATSGRANELWVGPTYQQDLGGLGVASNTVWPATAIGAVRLAWPVPDDLQTFQAARLAVIPGATTGSVTLTILVCAAKNADAALANCAGPFTQTFAAVANHLTEVDISSAVAPKITAPGQTYLSVLAFSSPTTTTDHIVGLRFSYTPAPAVGVVGTDVANVALGTSALANHPTGTSNTAVGLLALASDTTGSSNTAVGWAALLSNTTGVANTAFGSGAIKNALIGNNNTAVGVSALSQIFSGNENTAVGSAALTSHGDEVITANTAVGYQALTNVRTGHDNNTAVGHRALSLVQGTDNIALGKSAGANLSSGSNNIYIGNVGTDESGTLRIATAGTHTRAYIAGIRGTATGLSDAIPVVIDSSGQLGTISSSARLKEDIRDMGDASRRLLDLRPVTFRYSRPYRDGSQPTQFGLIAEEVAKTFPELAVTDANGDIETVRYDMLNVLLLNEIQKQQRTIEELQRSITIVLQRLDRLTTTNDRP